MHQSNIIPAFLKSKKFVVLDLLVIFLLLVLPYYLFNGKFFIGGDDRRLYSSFPWEILSNIMFYSWSNVASVGYHNPAQGHIPFLIFWTILELIINNKLIISYFAFSFPLIAGFIYFKRFLGELIENIHPIQSYIATFFFILSPIISVIALSYFLTWAFLIGLIPIVCFYFIRYLKTSDKSYVLKNIFASILFSIASYSVPWILGFILPIFLGGLIGVFLYQKKQIYNFLRKFTFFFTVLGFSQLFWILPVLSMFLVKGASFGEQISIISESFYSTVMGTANGSIIYPLLNLFHRQLVMELNWQVKEVFVNFYDRIFFLNTIFLGTVLAGTYYIKKMPKEYIKTFVMVFSSFIVSLYFFTVNIGILKDIFLLGGHISFSVMFRNFYDKFALGFVFIYATLLALALGVIIKNFRKSRVYIFFILLGVIFLNAIPIKDVINNKLWTTRSTYKSITIPDEYMNFVSDVGKNVDPTAYILNLPFNIGGYNIIKDQENNNVYAGTSTLKVFTGLNDIAGNYSFPGAWYGAEIKNWWDAIMSKDYKKIIETMEKFRMNYVITTNNIPEEVKNSYLFNKGYMIKIQNSEFVSAITDKKLLTSENGNYTLYSAKKRNLLIESENLYFQKINPTKYLVYIKNVKPGQKIYFYESFHQGWKIYPTTKHPECINSNNFVASDDKNFECHFNHKLFEIEDLAFLFKNASFEDSHKSYNQYFNSWTVDVSSNSKSLLKRDNSAIDASFVIYFMPQSFFYLGSIFSVLTFIISAIFLTLKRKWVN